MPRDVARAFVDDMITRASREGETIPRDLDAAVQALPISKFVNDIGPGL